LSDDRLGSEYQKRILEMEANYRRQEARMEAAARAAVKVEEQRILQSLDRLLTPADRERAAAFLRGVESITEDLPRADPLPKSPAELDVRALHVLARLDSALRHSVVESCLMNLKSFGQAMSDRPEDLGLMESLGEQVALIPGVAQQVIDFFSRPLVMGVSLRDLLPLSCKAALGATNGVLKLFQIYRNGRGDLTGSEVTEKVDLLTESLSSLRTYLDSRKVPLNQPVEQAVRALGPTLGNAGIAIAYADETDGDARLFLNESRITDAVAELLRNVARHGQSARRVRVTVSEARPPSTDTLITVTDDGAGFSEEVLKHFGERGISTSGGGEGVSLVMETVKEHFGRIEANNLPHGGARVTIFLPRRPELAPDAVDR
jgi:signal transduction histidine kinase